MLRVPELSWEFSASLGWERALLLLLAPGPLSRSELSNLLPLIARSGCKCSNEANWIAWSAGPKCAQLNWVARRMCLRQGDAAHKETRIIELCDATDVPDTLTHTSAKPLSRSVRWRKCQFTRRPACAEPVIQFGANLYPGINHIKPGSLLLPLLICDTLIKGQKGAIFNEGLQKSKLPAQMESRPPFDYFFKERFSLGDCHQGVVNSPGMNFGAPKLELFLKRSYS